MFAVNRELIAGSGVSVWLRAGTDLLWNRIAADQATLEQRPSLTDLDGRQEVDQLLQLRNPVYEACADYTIDVGELSSQEIAVRIVNWFQLHLILSFLVK